MKTTQVKNLFLSNEVLTAEQLSSQYIHKNGTQDEGTLQLNGITYDTKSTSLGYGCYAGGKYFKFTDNNVTAKTFTLGDSTVDDISKITIGLRYSCDSDNNYDAVGKITAVNSEDKTITVDNIPNVSYSSNGRRNILWFPDAPWIGDKILGSQEAVSENNLLNTYAHAEGISCFSFGMGAHAEGQETRAAGKRSHAEGFRTIAGYAAHAEGRETSALTAIAHAEGYKTLASGYASHAEGVKNIVTGYAAHVEGCDNKSTSYESHAEGYLTHADGNYSHTEGYKTLAGSSFEYDVYSKSINYEIGDIVRYQHSNSVFYIYECIKINGPDTNIVNPYGSTGEHSGQNYWKELYTDQGQHAEGCFSHAIGGASHVEGSDCQAIGYTSHAEGKYTVASGYAAHAEGKHTVASGYVSHTEGSETIAIGKYSHAEGLSCYAIGEDSHAEGLYTKTLNVGEHACGKYNKSSIEDKTLFTVGNGISDSNRKNAFEIHDDGTTIINPSGGIDGFYIGNDNLSKILVKNNNYTAFEVLVNNTEISAGTTLINDIDLITEYSDTTLYRNGSLVKWTDDKGETNVYKVINGKEFSGIKPSNTEFWMIYSLSKIEVKNTIPASNIHQFSLRSYTSRNNIDVIIDWGDGEITELKTAPHIELSAQLKTNEEVEELYSDKSTVVSWNHWKANVNANNVEHNITVGHKYNQTESLKTYIVKIYGKDYWGIGQLTSESYSRLNISIGNNNKFNLLSRCLENDLPIAPNVVNISSLCNRSSRLLQVNGAKYLNTATNVYNFSSLFQYCKNLVNVSGLTNLFVNKIPVHAESVFFGSNNIKSFEYVLPSHINLKQYSLASTFRFDANGNGNRDLEIDIIDLLPPSGFVNKFISVKNAFSHMYELTCSDYNKLAKLLWEDKSINWLDTESCFTRCGLDSSKIPVSWGGTNSQIDFDLNNKNVVDYTSFQVYPTESVISGKTSLEQYLADNPTAVSDEEFLELSARSWSGNPDFQYIEDIQPQMTHGLEIYIDKDQKDCDVIIDWGDGSKFDIIKNLTVMPIKSIPSYTEGTSKYYNLSGLNGLIYYDTEENIIQVVHTYEKEGKYDVKIYGKDYYLIRSSLFYGLKIKNNGQYNLISDAFGTKYKIASQITNIASFFFGNERFQKFYLPSNFNLELNNITSLFAKCSNLIDVECSSSSKLFSQNLIHVASLFSGCKNLKNINFIFPSNVNGQTTPNYSGMFQDCESLEADLLKILPSIGFINKIIKWGTNDPSIAYGSYIFYNCKSLTCSDYNKLANILWNDTSKIFENYKNIFKSCTSLDLTKIPIAWGGTANIDIDENTGTVKVDLTEVNELMNVIITNTKDPQLYMEQLLVGNIDNNDLNWKGNILEYEDIGYSKELYSKLKTNTNILSTDFCLGDFSKIKKIYKVADNYNTITSNIFDGNESLVELSSSEISNINKQFILQNSSISSIYIPSLIKCSSNTFRKSKLVYAYLPNLNSTTTSWKFGESSQLLSIDISNAKTIESGDFYGCKALSSIKCDSVEQLNGDYPFNNCAFEYIYLPKLTKISNKAFLNCSKLLSIDFGNSLTAVPTVLNNSFENIGHEVSCYIPNNDDLYNQWLNADVWKDLIANNTVEIIKHS